VEKNEKHDRNKKRITLHPGSFILQIKSYMMINRLVLILILVAIIGGCKNNTVSISGKFSNPVKGEYLFLHELKANSLTTVDSLKVGEDGSFSFRREITIPTFYMLKSGNNSFLLTLVEPGEKLKIDAIQDSLNYPLSVSGSKGTEKLAEYNKALNNTISKIRSLYEIYSQNSGNPDLPKVVQTLDSMRRQYIKEINVYTKRFIDENINSMVTLVALYQQVEPGSYVLDPVKDIGYFIKVDSSLFRLYPGSEPVKALHEQVQQLVSQVGSSASPGMGNEAPEISLPDPQGKIVSLSSTRGNIVLLDFWASWCGPCRKENPNLVLAFNKYNGKGFGIFQVSLDKSKEEWLKGIREDKLSAWIHVSDLKYWNSVVVPQYKIEAIPFNLLLDKDGKILASNLRGESLLKKLDELYR
jgi:thiol-disulfide isomerase/thioredoxin